MAVVVPGTVLQLDRLADLASRRNFDLGLLVDRGFGILAILVVAWIGRRLLNVVTSRLRHLADDADPTTLSSVLRDLAREFHEDAAWRPAFAEAPEVLGVEALADAAVNLRVLQRTLHLGSAAELIAAITGRAGAGG